MFKLIKIINIYLFNFTKKIKTGENCLPKTIYRKKIFYTLMGKRKFPRLETSNGNTHYRRITSNVDVKKKKGRVTETLYNNPNCGRNIFILRSPPFLIIVTAGDVLVFIIFDFFFLLIRILAVVGLVMKEKSKPKFTAPPHLFNVVMLTVTTGLPIFLNIITMIPGNIN